MPLPSNFPKDSGKTLLSRSLMNQLLNWLRNFVGSIQGIDGVKVSQGMGGVTIGLHPEAIPKSPRLAKVTGYAGPSNRRLKVKILNHLMALNPGETEIEVFAWTPVSFPVDSIVRLQWYPHPDVSGSGTAPVQQVMGWIAEGNSAGVVVKTFKCESFQTVSGKTIMRGKIQNTDGSLETTNTDVYAWSFPAEGTENLANVFPQIAVGKFYPIMQMQEKWISGTAAIRWFVVGLVGGTCVGT